MTESDRYINLDMKRCEKYLDAAAWALDILNQELLEKNVVKSEKYKVNLSTDEAKLSEDAKIRAKQLEQFYTIPELANEIFEKFQSQCSAFTEDEKSWYLEPSAGRGDIYRTLPEGRRVGVDLEPKYMEIKQMNFFDTTRENLGIPSNAPLALVGNPPFQPAVNFFNHAAEVLKAEYIAWILPNIFLSTKKRSQLNPYFHLIYVLNITCCYNFNGKIVNLPTMFGIWKRKPYRIVGPPSIIEQSPYFEVLSSTTEKNDILDNDPTSLMLMRKAYTKTGMMQPTFDVMVRIFREIKSLKRSPMEAVYTNCFWLKYIPNKEKSKEEIMEYFNKFDWRKMKGQYVSARVSKDWDIPSRISLNKRDIYAAFNIDKNYEYNPYVEFTERGNQKIIQNRSSIKKNNITRSNRVIGGSRKKTRKKQRYKKTT